MNIQYIKPSGACTLGVSELHGLRSKRKVGTVCSCCHHTEQSHLLWGPGEEISCASGLLLDIKWSGSGSKQMWPFQVSKGWVKS